MKPQITIFILSLFFLKWDSYSQERNKVLTLETGTGYEVNNSRWSIAGNLHGQSPNILSELKFKEIASLGYYIKGSYLPFKFLKLKAYYKQSFTISGNGTDTDYKSDNRTNPTFDQTFKSDEGWHKVFKVGAGAPISLFRKIKVCPSVFYYQQNQKFYLLSSEEENLRSNYATTMQGVEFSLVSHIELGRYLYTSITINHRFVNYKAEADWNLIDIFQHPLSFSHISNGYGSGVNIDFGGDLSETFSIVIGGMLDGSIIKNGIDTAYLITGNEVPTQFNGAKNLMYGFKLGVYISI